MALFNIKEKDFSIIINEMEQDIEKVDPISFLKAYHIRSIIPTYIHIIEKLLGFCPKSWFKDIKTSTKIDVPTVVCDNLTVVIRCEVV